MSNNLNSKGLNNLYNQKVVSYETVSRPMNSSGDKKSVPFFEHQGVVLTTQNGGQYLVHNGPEYGKNSGTVITDAKNMGSSWQHGTTHDVTNGKTVGQISGGQINKGDYSLSRNNCYQAQNNIVHNAEN